MVVSRLNGLGVRHADMPPEWPSPRPESQPPPPCAPFGPAAADTQRYQARRQRHYVGSRAVATSNRTGSGDRAPPSFHTYCTFAPRVGHAGLISAEEGSRGRVGSEPTIWRHPDGTDPDTGEKLRVCDLVRRGEEILGRGHTPARGASWRDWYDRLDAMQRRQYTATSSTRRRHGVRIRTLDFDAGRGRLRRPAGL